MSVRIDDHQLVNVDPRQLVNVNPHQLVNVSPRLLGSVADRLNVNVTLRQRLHVKRRLLENKSNCLLRRLYHRRRQRRRATPFIVRCYSRTDSRCQRTHEIYKSLLTTDAAHRTGPLVHYQDGVT